MLACRTFVRSLCRTPLVKMPMVSLVSNIPDEKIPKDFEIRFAKVLSKSMNKPEERIAVEIRGGARVVHGGSHDPVVLITVKSIGALGSEVNVKHVEAFTKFVGEELGLPPSKVVIDFVDLNPENVGHFGTTVAAAHK